MRIQRLNERAHVRWADVKEGKLRLRYRSRLYGQCSLSFRIELGNDDSPSLIRDSLNVEQVRPRSAGAEILRKSAVDFLDHAIHRQPEVFHPANYRDDSQTSWWRRLARRWGLVGQSIEA